MTYKIRCGFRFEDAKFARRVTVKSPAWLKKYVFFTHKFPSGWRMSEASTGFAIPDSAYSVTRSIAQKKGVRQLAHCGRARFRKAMREAKEQIKHLP